MNNGIRFRMAMKNIEFSPWFEKKRQQFKTQEIIDIYNMLAEIFPNDPAYKGLGADNAS